MDERNNNFDFDFTPIGQAIKKAREARGMTREQLSGIIGYSQTYSVYRKRGAVSKYRAIYPTYYDVRCVG